MKKIIHIETKEPIYEIKDRFVFRTSRHKHGYSSRPDFTIVANKMIPTILNPDFQLGRLVIRGHKIYKEGGIQAIFEIK